jgi:hypothetical protein
MHRLRSKRVILLLAAVFAAGGLATAALSAVLSQQVIADTNGVHIRIVRTAVDSFDSGWHIHPGIAVVQVQSGSFQIYQNSCTPVTVSAGQTYIEIPHLAVRAIASGPTVWTTTLLTTAADPPQIPAAPYYNVPNFNPCPSLP